MNKKGRTRNWVALLVLSLLEFEFYLAIFFLLILMRDMDRQMIKEIH